MPDILCRAQGCLVGLACGDALGTTVEFQPPGSFAPLTDLVGGGPFQLPPGAWTDDTSMALCLAASLIECGFNPADQMRRYCRWWTEGYYSSTGRCFDIGIATRAALARFQATGDPFAGSTDPSSAGNGCLMRLAPAVIYHHADPRLAEERSVESARTTHGAAECLEATRLFAAMLHRALAGQGKRDILLAHDPTGFLEPKVQGLARGEYLNWPREKIAGAGYVIRALEAAAWCFFQTASYREAVLLAANLGDDADTTAAICGQLAGAFYGVDEIPTPWRQQLVLREEIEQLAEQLVRRGAAKCGASRRDE